MQEDNERLTNTEEQKLEAWVTTMNSVQSIKERLAGLSDEQIYAEFKASELGPEQLAIVRTQHDEFNREELQFYAIRSAGERGAPIPEVAQDNIKFLRYYEEGLADRATDLHISVKEGANISDEIFDVVRKLLADVRDRIKNLSSADSAVDTTTVLPDNLSEIIRTDVDELRFNSWMAGQRAEDPERTLRLDNPQARAEYAASLQGADQLAEARAQSDQAWREICQSTAAAQERRSLMTDDEKRKEFAASTPQEFAKVKGEVDAATASRQQSVNGVAQPQAQPKADRLTNTDQQKFEAWQGVMGSLESEKPRMALLSDSQRRAEYEASQVGPERFQAVRAEHDLVNGYAAVKAAAPEKGSLSHWANELTEAANKTRRPLSGSEFKQIVSSIENCSRGADLEKAKAREVAGLLAKVHGPSGESLFRDPELRNAYKAAITPDQSPHAVSPANQNAADQVDSKNARTAAPMRMR